MPETMKMTLEEMEKRLKIVESMCICRNCPTYKNLRKDDDYIAYWFPTRGESKKFLRRKGVPATFAQFTPK